VFVTPAIHKRFFKTEVPSIMSISDTPHIELRCAFHIEELLLSNYALDYCEEIMAMAEILQAN
jgi:hypothetical protein